jgi:hypothetical protein
VAPPDFGRGEPGQQVTPEDTKLMALRPNRWFFDSEIVAWKRSDGSFAYGQVVDLDEPATGPETDAVPGVRGVVVDTGLGRQQTFLPSQLWCFVSELADKPAVAKAAPRREDFSTSALEERPSANQISMATHNVSREQYVEALNSMLVMAGLPPSLDTTELVDKNLALRTKLASVEAQLKVSAKAAAEAEKKLNALTEEARCPICMRSKR